MSVEDHRVAVLRAQGFTVADTQALAAGQITPAVQARMARSIQRRRNLAWLPLLGGVAGLAILPLMFLIDAPPITYLSGLVFPFGVLGTVLMRAVANNRSQQMRGELTVVEGALRKGTDRINRRTRIFLELDGWRLEDGGPVIYALFPLAIEGQRYRAYLAPGPFLLAIEPLPAAPTLLRGHGPAFTSFVDDEG